jgi:hypothetical protein
MVLEKKHQKRLLKRLSKPIISFLPGQKSILLKYFFLSQVKIRVLNQNELLGLLCFLNPFNEQLSAYDLLIVTLGSLFFISILFLYYNKIPKINLSITELEHPIYKTKDIFLQSSSNDANFIITQSSASTRVKISGFVVIAFVFIIPVDQLFSLVNCIH